MIAERITQIVASPAEPRETGTSKNWEKIEKRLGLQLPQDYKNVIDAYGTGSFDDFIIVYNPFVLKTNISTYSMRWIPSTRPTIRLNCWVIPFGRLYTLLSYILHPRVCFPGAVPPIWEIPSFGKSKVSLPPGRRSFIICAPMSEFLYRLFIRQIESVLLPDDYPSSAITFISVG